MITMATLVSAGNRGERDHGDCWVSFSPDGSVLDIVVEQCESDERKETIETFVYKVLKQCQVASGSLKIYDQGAPAFVMAARIEACLRQAGYPDARYLPGMIDQNTYQSSAKRMRLSRLYLPGNTPKLAGKGASSGAHGIILDLEDSVAPARKFEARIMVRNTLQQVDFAGAERMVRINQLPLGLDDLREIAGQNVHMILIPKCESAETIQKVNDVIAEVNGPDGPPVFLMPIIESCLGVLRAEEMASAADNVVALTIGLEDYTADLGVKRTYEATESFYARSHLVNVCRACGIQAIDSVFSDVSDMEALADNVTRSKGIGFEGMGCIHPRQVSVVHENFAPDSKEIDKAKKIVQAFNDAMSRGLGVVALGSKMIDPPVVERAQQTISQAVAMELLSSDWITGQEVC